VVLCRLVVLGTGDFSLDVGYLLGEGHALRQKWDVMKPTVGLTCAPGPFPQGQKRPR
jgi:hypothetical protein